MVPLLILPVVVAATVPLTDWKAAKAFADGGRGDVALVLKGVPPVGDGVVVYLYDVRDEIQVEVAAARSVWAANPAAAPRPVVEWAAERWGKTLTHAVAAFWVLSRHAGAVTKSRYRSVDAWVDR